VSRLGGPEGNERLTAAVAVALLLLLVVEGATILRIGQLLRVHMFVGMLLVPVVALKLGTAGWRFLRYYAGDSLYVLRGPPHPLLRVLAPLLVATTTVLFGTGIALLAIGPHHPGLAQLHQLSFIAWIGVAGVHVLAHARRVARVVADEGRRRVPGLVGRYALVVSAVVAGVTLALETSPLDDRWFALLRL
jgi:hypothetical protein